MAQFHGDGVPSYALIEKGMNNMVEVTMLSAMNYVTDGFTNFKDRINLISWFELKIDFEKSTIEFDNKGKTIKDLIGVDDLSTATVQQVIQALFWRFSCFKNSQFFIFF